MIFTRTWKFFKALGCGFLASGTSRDIPKAGVKVEQGSLLGQAFAEGYREDLLECVRKLNAAADALRQIECLTADKVDIYVMEQIHSTAQTAYRAAIN